MIHEAWLRAFVRILTQGYRLVERAGVTGEDMASSDRAPWRIERAAVLQAGPEPAALMRWSR